MPPPAPRFCLAPAVRGPPAPPTAPAPLGRRAAGPPIPYSPHSEWDWQALLARPPNPAPDVAEVARRLGRRLWGVLYPYQRDALCFIVRCGGACLLSMDMGTGKTLVSICAVLIQGQAKGQAPFDPRPLLSLPWDAPGAPPPPLTLVLSPSSVVGKWREDLVKWLECDPRRIAIRHQKQVPKMEPADDRPWFVITTYETLRSHKAWFEAQKFQAVIADECQKLRNEKSQLTRAVGPIVRGCATRLLLSGEPMNVPSNLPALLHLLCPSLLPLANAHSFRARYCRHSVRYDKLGNYHFSFPGSKREEELHALLCKLVMFRLSAAQAAESMGGDRRGAASAPAGAAPPLCPEVAHRRILWVTLDPKKATLHEGQVLEYKQVCQELKDRDASWAADRRASGRVGVEVAEDRDLDDDGGTSKKKAMFLEFRRTTAVDKIEACRPWLLAEFIRVRAAGQKVIVFGEHRVVLDRVVGLVMEAQAHGGGAADEGPGRDAVKRARARVWGRRLWGTLPRSETAEGLGPLLLAAGRDQPRGEQKARFAREGGGAGALPFIRIDGAASQRARTELVRQFQHDAACWAAVVSIGAGGCGIELTSGSELLFVELPWSADLIHQGEARAVRIGQTKSVQSTFLVCKDTVEMDVLQIVKRKLGAIAKCMNNQKQSNFTWVEETLEV